MPISIKITYSLFGKYDKAVTKDDWKRIKKRNKRAYKYILDKKNIGHCYYISWILALWLNDAKLIYCSIRCSDGHHTGHAVVLRNNCVYDTNLRMNCDLDEYIKELDAEVYKIFDEEVYRTESFFQDIYQDFYNWCSERNVYCDPQKDIPTKKEDKA